MKQNQRWNALHAELLRRRGVPVHVYLNDFEFALVLRRHLLENGCHRFAGATPISVEINQYRHSRAIDKFGERFFRHKEWQLDGFGRRLSSQKNFTTSSEIFC